jgi:hypothetical protein
LSKIKELQGNWIFRNAEGSDWSELNRVKDHCLIKHNNTKMSISHTLKVEVKQITVYPGRKAMFNQNKSSK